MVGVYVSSISNKVCFCCHREAQECGEKRFVRLRASGGMDAPRHGARTERCSESGFSSLGRPPTAVMAESRLFYCGRRLGAGWRTDFTGSAFKKSRDPGRHDRLLQALQGSEGSGEACHSLV